MLYFNKADPRVFVPKRPLFGVPLGWTLNLGHDVGAWAFVGLLLSPTILMAYSLRR